MRRLFLALMVSVSFVSGATNYWTNTTGSTAYWTNPDNWLSGVVPNGIGEVVDFRADLMVTQHVVVDTPITVGSLILGDTNSPWIGQYLEGNGTLTFQEASGAASIFHSSSNANPQFFITCRMVLASDLVASNGLGGSSFWLTGAIGESGRHSLRLVGPGYFSLYGSNTFTGGTIIDNTLVTLDPTDPATPGNPAWGPCGAGDAPLTLLSGGIRCHGTTGKAITNANRIVLGGDISIPFQSIETNMVFLGPMTLSNGSRTITCDIGISNGQSVTWAGPIDDGGNGYGLTFQGRGVISLAATNTYGGDTVIRSGTVRLATSNVLPTGFGKGNLLLFPGAGTNAVLDFFGRDQSINGLSNAGGGTAILQNGHPTRGAIFSVGSNGSSSLYTGVVTNLSNWITMTKIGSGPAIFSNAVLSLGGHLILDGVSQSSLTLTGGTFLGANDLSIGYTNRSNDLYITGNPVVIVSNCYIGQAYGNLGRVFHYGGSVTVARNFRLGHYPNETSTWDMSGGTLTLTAAVTNDPFTPGISEVAGAMYMGIDGTGVFRQTGGTVTVPAIVLDNRNQTSGGDQYDFSGGILQITTGWGVRGNLDGKWTLGNGNLVTPADWTNSIPLVFTFTNTNTFTGIHTNPSPLVLSNGTLVLTGAFLGTNRLLVTNGATLAGTGAHNGTLMLSSNTSLHPGVPGSGMGSLSLSNVQFMPGSRFRVDLSGTPLSNTCLYASGTLSLGGTLEIVSTNGMATGAVYDLVVASNLTGSFEGLPDGATFVDRGRQFTVQIGPTFVRLNDLGPVQTVVTVTNPLPHAVVTSGMAFTGLASNQDPLQGLPRVYVSTNGGPLTFITQGSDWVWTPPWAILPHGSNTLSFFSVCSNGSTNRVDRDHFIDHQGPPTPVFFPGATNFWQQISVAITATDLGGIQGIYVTTDGSTPSLGSTCVSNGSTFVHSETTTMRAVAMDVSSNWGVEGVATFTRNPNQPGTGSIQSAVPNPFRPGEGSVVITLTRKTEEPVELVLFDIQGRTVCTLKSFLPDFAYACQFAWDGRLPGGQKAGRGLYRMVPKVSGILRSDLGARLYLY